MVSPVKQVVPRGGTAASRNEVEDLPSKDLRVKGPGPRLLLLYKKATSSRPGPWDKEDLLDVLYWLRQVIAILAGVAWGLVPLTGLYAFVGYMALCLGAPYFWYHSQEIDEEEYGGHGQLAGEGLAPSAALFVLVWIMAYTYAQL